MKPYDIKCPICGTINRNLILDETEGWMECEHCGQTVMGLPNPSVQHKKIPVYSPHQITLRFGTAQ